MFLDTEICGGGLPEKTLCLTYDDGPGVTCGDGPGPRTLEIGRFLADNKISAAFFAVGAHAARHPHILPQLKCWGHIIGNHTYNHLGLASSIENGRRAVDELERTDDLFDRLGVGPVRFFRAPYGSWLDESPSGKGIHSSVASRLNRSQVLKKYTGHIHWDICTCDYDFWKARAPAAECADFSLRLIESIGRGIVLFHDSSEDPQQRHWNRTYEVTTRIVPILLERGYRFVRLDEVPKVQAALGAGPSPAASAVA
ncbi:MAG TPA: polysaccharide deacetylase family protein [Planctomycetaceae bacterium]|jgi:peptidoglycan/xylan/chitin deacetylase (PgdA/CDA1 family)